MRTKDIKIKVGDSVKVIDCGKTYTSHPDREKLGISNTIDESPVFEGGTICTVFNTGVVNSNTNVVCIRDSIGRESLISVLGVELVEDDRMYKVSRQQLKEIYEHVCQDYKSKINKLLFDNMFDNEVTIKEHVVTQAHKDAEDNNTQRLWLEKYLPLPKKKKIEIVGCLYSSQDSLRINFDTSLQRLVLSNLKLIKLGYGSGRFDVFSAQDENEDFYILIGHYNDGVTED